MQLERSGVFGMLSLQLDADRVAAFEATRLIRPEGWPSAQLGTDLVPHADGYLPEEDPCTVSELLAYLGAQDDQYLGYSLRRGGSLELDAYFQSHDSFHCWFGAYTLLAWEAGRHGGKGWGAYIWDDECPEPVVFELAIAPGGVTVTNVDPQNPNELLERTRARCDAIREDKRGKLG